MRQVSPINSASVQSTLKTFMAAALYKNLFVSSALQNKVLAGTYFCKANDRVTCILSDVLEKNQIMIPSTLSTVDAISGEEIFNELYREWCEQTKFDSFVGNPYHSAYDKIVGLGEIAIPYIIAKVKQEPSLLFVALNRITGENPVKTENRGFIRKMIKDWVNWWEEKNHVNKNVDA